MLKHGILMTPDLAEKAHKGDKTVTRRLIRPQPPEWWDTCHWEDPPSYKPRYRPGDIVAIKETHWRWGYKKLKGLSVKNVPVYNFVAVDTQPIVFAEPHLLAWTKTNVGYHKISSLFLPFDDARTHVEILSVRPEWLQDITGDDAIAEGIEPPEGYCHPIRGDASVVDMKVEPRVIGHICKIDLAPPAVEQFEGLWDSINFKRAPWESNPWVWRYSFKAVEKP